MTKTGESLIAGFQGQPSGAGASSLRVSLYKLQVQTGFDQVLQSETSHHAMQMSSERMFAEKALRYNEERFLLAFSESSKVALGDEYGLQ